MDKVLSSFPQPGIEARYLHSDIIDQDFMLYIKLPWTYGQCDRTYPVLFALDGNRSFPLYSTMSLVFETPGTSSEEIVIVGIGYKLDTVRIRGLAQWAMWRTRDLTPVRSDDTERFWSEKLSALLKRGDVVVNSGGAPAFLEFLRKELIPFVEVNYRVSSKGRGLAGYSYGGLFTLYVLFHAVGLFDRYFAGSPTMWNQLFDYEEDYANAHDDLQAKVFIAAGGLETDLHEPLERIVDRLRARQYPGLDLETCVFDGEGHASAYAASVSRALCVLYDKQWLSI